MEGELFSAPVALTKGDDGVWSVTLTDHVADVYKYCFVVDGTKSLTPPTCTSHLIRPQVQHCLRPQQPIRCSGAWRHQLWKGQL